MTSAVVTAAVVASRDRQRSLLPPARRDDGTGARSGAVVGFE